MIGGILLAESLHRLGVRDMFMLHGGHLDPLLIGCASLGIRLIDTRHEATAGHAAEVMGMLKPDTVGVCAITAGPAFTNALTAMASAYANALPALFIAGAPPTRETETNELQGGFSQLPMAVSVTKWAHRILSGDRIPDIVEKAMRIAQTGRPGPVLLEVPIDIMFREVPRVLFPIAETPSSPAKPAPSTQDAKDFLAAIASAERPVLIGGTGAITSGAGTAIDRFARLTGVPVVTNSKAHGLLPHDHPANFGPASTLAVLNATGAPRPDLVILAGARAGLLLGGRSHAIIPKDARLLQIDIEASEIGRMTPVELGLVADAAETFELLDELATEQSWPELAEWRATLAKAHNFAPFEQEEAVCNSGRLHPHHAAKAVFDAISPDATVVVDGGEMTAWCEPLNRASRPGGYLTAGYLGTLGFGPGYAIGAAVARPETPVFLIAGDGAIGFHLQEFDTMARHNLPIITIIMNNACWAMSKNGQDLVFGKEHRVAVDLCDRAYEDVARALGCDGERVERIEDIGPAIARACASGRPTCINIATDADVVHPITFGMAGTDPTKGKIAMPYYQNENG
ncbi:MAG: thiamine pyrophosphate-binding protein [Parasphingorhabdus sp.]|uniref:thiamine pyrophosphate-binding protein n=1 Tax=Parasphingorhabdus sp. TaxID=2709688 RepID=UPI003001492B